MTDIDGKPIAFETRAPDAVIGERDAGEVVGEQLPPASDMPLEAPESPSKGSEASEQEATTSKVHVTPSGLEIRFSWEPKRMYELRGPQDKKYTATETALKAGWKPPQGTEQVEDYWRHPAAWAEVPGVTDVLKVLDKPALPWWGMTIGVRGVLDLYERGLLRPGLVLDPPQLACPGRVGIGTAGFIVAGPEQVVEMLKEQKLTVNHVRDKAGDRGQSCHDAFELWATEGTIPEPAMFPPEERGYIIGLLKFITHVTLGEPVFESTEVVVGSPKHGYAGRYDWRMKTTKECTVVKHHTPVKGDQFATLAPGSYLGDVKTSKDVYPESHFRQLEAYEGASVESGYEKTAARGVLNITEDGRYKFVRSTAKLKDFLCVLEVYKSNDRIKGRKGK